MQLKYAKDHLADLGQQMLSLVAHYADEAEVSVSEVAESSVSIRDNQVEQCVSSHSHLMSLTVIKNKAVANVSTTKMDLSELKRMSEKAKSIVSVTQADAYAGLAPKELYVKGPSNFDAFYPWSISTSALVQYGQSIEESAQSIAGIKQVDGVELDLYHGAIWQGNTSGLSAFFKDSVYGASATCLAKDGDRQVRDHAYTAARNPEQLLPPDQLGISAAQQTVARIGARSIPAQVVPVLFSNAMARQVLGQFANAIFGSTLYRNASFLSDQLGQPVFPKNITIHQRPHLSATMGSQYFDTDGVKTSDRCIIDEGRLSSYLLGIYAARRMGMTSTGNADGIQTWHVKDHQALQFKDILSSMTKGLYVTEMMGSGTNLATGDYSRGIFGYWVEQGQIQFPVHEVTISGNLKDMFLNCQAIACDQVDRRGRIQTGPMLIEGMTVAG